MVAVHLLYGPPLISLHSRHYFLGIDAVPFIAVQGDTGSACRGLVESFNHICDEVSGAIHPRPIKKNRHGKSP